MKTTHCYHCGDSCNDTVIKIDQKYFCCKGCKTVYEIFSEKPKLAVINFSMGATCSNFGKKPW